MRLIRSLAVRDPFIRGLRMGGKAARAGAGPAIRDDAADRRPTGPLGCYRSVKIKSKIK